MSSFIPEEQIDFKDDDNFDKKYRSIAVVPDVSSQFNCSFLDVPFEPQTRLASSLSTKATRLQFPPKPTHIGKYSFTMKDHNNSYAFQAKVEDQFEAVVHKVGAYLGFDNKFYFSLIPGSKFPMWKGKYMEGTICCEVDVNIYNGDACNTFIVEAIRMKGDAPSFHAFFRSFKSLATNTEEKTRRAIVTPPSILLVLGKPKDTSKSFEPIFTLCKSEYCEKRLEGTKMLYNLLRKWQDDEGVRESNFIKSCVLHLEKLIFDDFHEVAHQAILVFESLLQIPGYKSVMMESNALPFLFSMVEYVPEPFYATIHVRRACASIIASLAQHDSVAFIKKLESNGDDVLGWTNRVHELRFDSQIHRLGEEARSNLVGLLV